MARRVLAPGMRSHARFLLLATLAVGTAVFGVTLVALAFTGPLDPRAAVAGILAAASLTAALLGLVWARRRAGGRPSAGRRGAPAPVATSPLTVVPLGDGQAAVIFAERPARAPAVAEGRRAAEADADAIWAAVAAATATATPPAGIPGPATAPRRPLAWIRRRPRRPGPGGPPRDSR